MTELTPCQASGRPDDWHPTAHTAAHARALCLNCPTADKAACLEAALDHEGDKSLAHRHGYWGGTTPEERVRIHLDNGGKITAGARPGPKTHSAFDNQVATLIRRRGYTDKQISDTLSVQVHVVASARKRTGAVYVPADAPPVPSGRGVRHNPVQGSVRAVKLA